MGRPPGVEINGAALRHFREEVAELTTRGVAEEVPCSPGSYSGIESGTQRPSLQMLYRICKVIGIPVWLITTDQEAIEFAAEQDGAAEVAA